MSVAAAVCQDWRARGTGLRIVGVVWLCAALVLPLLGYSAAEAEPSHEHIMVGGSAGEQIRALARHLHHRFVALSTSHPSVFSAGSETVSVSCQARAVSVRGSGAAGVSVFGFGNALPVGAGRPVVPILPLAGRAVVQPSASGCQVILPIPDPPPRWS